jgi:hypothetical protein
VVEAVGSHHDLMKTCALYQRLYELQFDSQSALDEPRSLAGNSFA